MSSKIDLVNFETKLDAMKNIEAQVVELWKLLVSESNSADNIQKSQEIYAVAKFIIASQQKIKVVEIRERPDFVIELNGEILGLEVVECVASQEKAMSEAVKHLILNAQETFIAKYGDIKKLVRIGLRFGLKQIIPPTKLNQKCRNMASDYPHLNSEQIKNYFLITCGLVTKDALKRMSSEIADKVHAVYMSPQKMFQRYTTDYESYISSIFFDKHNTTHFSAGSNWIAGNIDERLNAAVTSKENKIANYRLNVKAEQALLIVIHGSNSYSDYSILNVEVFKGIATDFKHIWAFNLFTAEIYTLK